MLCSCIQYTKDVQQRTDASWSRKKATKRSRRDFRRGQICSQIWFQRALHFGGGTQPRLCQWCFPDSIDVYNLVFFLEFHKWCFFEASRNKWTWGGASATERGDGRAARTCNVRVGVRVDGPCARALTRSLTTCAHTYEKKVDSSWPYFWYFCTSEAPQYYIYI